MFETHFWQVFPRRKTTPTIQGSKSKIRKKLEDAIKQGETTWEQIKESLENYAKSDKVQKGYIQMPMTWVNAEGWNYEYTTPLVRRPENPDEWRRILGKPGPFTRQHWINNWPIDLFGPEPGQPNCRVPAEIIYEYGWIRKVI